MMLEKGVHNEYEEIILGMRGKGEQRSWRHLKRNPFGETPTLELPDDTMISETSAVARYIDQSHPGRKIMGATPLEQAQDQMWDSRIWVHMLYRLTVAFHVSVGPELVARILGW